MMEEEAVAQLSEEEIVQEVAKRVAKRINEAARAKKKQLDKSFINGYNKGEGNLSFFYGGEMEVILYGLFFITGYLMHSTIVYET